AVVVEHDQNVREGYRLFFTLIFIVGLLGTWNLNWQNSIYHYYRREIKRKFLVGWNGDEKSKVGEIPFHDCNVTQVGLPYPILLGAWFDNHFQVSPFLFTPNYIGITNRNTMIEEDQSTCLQETRDYRVAGMSRELVLSDAVAISGSAVTPMMTKNIYLAMLLDFFGVNLGQWLRKPSSTRPLKTWLLGYWTHVRRWLPKSDSFGFVADGGFEEILGAYELLRRRCELIIVSDACCNSDSDELSALATLIESANTNLGIQFLDLDHETPIDFGRLKRNKDSNIPQQYILMRVRYPASESKNQESDSTDEQHQEDETQCKEGLLVYAQMSITENDPIEIRQIKQKFPSFPDEPTSNQFYSKEQVAAYQKLGYYIGTQICHELVRWSPVEIKAANVHRNRAKQGEVITKDYYDEREFYGVHNIAKNDDLVISNSAEMEEFEVAKMDMSELDPTDFHRPPDQPLPPNTRMPKPIGQPLFDVIQRRLLTGYRLACFEEAEHSKIDIFSEAIWDRNEWCFSSFGQNVDDLAPKLKSVNDCSDFEERLSATQELCYAWLKEFQLNADIRAVYRNLVFLDINRGMLSTECNSECSSLAVLTMMVNRLRLPSGNNLDNSVIAAAHFAVIAVACQQFHRGIPKTIFQIGGREKLVDLMSSMFLTVNNRKGTKDIRPNLPVPSIEPWHDWLIGNSSELMELK
ncbi:MAG: hypothetical protein AAGA30_18045, partial [Planctomycetota bacterium]